MNVLLTENQTQNVHSTKYYQLVILQSLKHSQSVNEINVIL